MYLGRLLSYGAIWWVKLPQYPLQPDVSRSECMKMYISDCTHVLPALLCIRGVLFRGLLCIGTIQGSTNIYIYLVLIQKQLRYLYLLLSHHHSPTSSCDLAILNTFLSTNFGAKASEYQTSFITCTSWDLFWVTAGPRTIIDGKLQTA